MTARIRLSVRNCRTRRPRPAPMAIRTATSRRRPSDFASTRFPTLATAIRSTSPTAASRIRSAVCTPPTISSCSEWRPNGWPSGFGT